MKIGSVIPAFCLLLTLPLAAQHTAPYNVEADAALSRGDYRDARMYFSEGVPHCDLYSIGGLIWIWIDNPSMRSSMQSLIERCHRCLIDRHQGADTSVVALLEIGYSAGIFSEPYWQTLPLSASIAKPPAPVDILAEIPVPAHRYITPKSRPLILLACHLSPDHPAGLSLGVLSHRRWGAYVRYSRSLSSLEPLYGIRQFPDQPTRVESLPDNHSLAIAAGGVPKALNSYRLSAGALYRLSSPVFLAAGLGYGERTRLYKYTLTHTHTGEQSSPWCTFPDYNLGGIVIEADLFLRYRKLFAGVGCAAIDLSHAEASFTVGILF
ncbi:MAG: hypothetical protein LBU08_01280 [Tannerellaceae bacterium]|jgi:hypothetical protein|nr:hypothetical protein [Tannerellaceae bacterium]